MKRFQSATFSSKSRTKPPLQLDEKLTYISKTLEELQDTIAQEITVTDNIEQNSLKVIFIKNYETHTRQINALRNTVDGLGKTFLSSFDALYDDAKAYANREIMALIPRIDASYNKCEQLDSNVLRNNIDITSLRRELNDRYEFLNSRIDLMGADLKEVKEKQMICKEDITQICEELRRLKEKQLDASASSSEKFKNLNEKTKKNIELLEELDKKLGKHVLTLSSDSKKSYETFIKKIKDYDETCQEQLNSLRTNFLEHSKEIQSISTQVSENIEKISEIKSDFTSKHEDLFESINLQIKKVALNYTTLNEKFEALSESTQENYDEINKSFANRLDAVSKTLMNENRSLSERVYKQEKLFDVYQRETNNSVNVLERSLAVHEEKLNFSISNKY
ncbi:hypothetical protein SteCoe_11939 [Stentor coeruleus]|uniref:Uncharacterized protein n=1 Tax=Stentor coeruleus TaxID=5963 RepID=A0A1R2CBY0_9CILI|nr:hypothetical protein SteCoe_11939 [Stentor coeruleus]